MVDYAWKHPGPNLAIPLKGDNHMWKTVKSIISSFNYIFLLIIAAAVSYMFFSGPKAAPIIIDQISVVSDHIKVNQPLQLQIHAKVTKQHCDMYAERTVVEEHSNKVVWFTVSPVNSNVLAGEIDSKIPIEVNVPNLVPGKYYYTAKLHVICGSTVDIVPTKLLPFTVDGAN
jgi:hypothetical protein